MAKQKPNETAYWVHDDSDGIPRIEQVIVLRRFNAVARQGLGAARTPRASIIHSQLPSNKPLVVNASTIRTHRADAERLMFHSICYKMKKLVAQMENL